MRHVSRGCAAGGKRRIRISTDDTTGGRRRNFPPAAANGRAEIRMQRADHLLDELEELFDRIDLDGDRRIAFGEFSELMLEIDDTRGEHTLRAAFEAIDVNHDGRVGFDELRRWWKASHPTPA
jgi:hypothetical protein